MKLTACYKALALAFLVKDRSNITIKIPLVMKLTAIIMLSFCLQISAKSAGQTITLSEKNASLKKILKGIKNQSGVVFFYEEELLKKSSSVNISVKDATLTEVLKMVFQKQELLTYEMIGNKIITIKERSYGDIEIDPTTYSAPIDTTITGIVSDDKGNPIGGATITVKGGKNSVITDDGGRYAIKVPDSKAVLIFSYVGYKEVVQKVGQDGVLNIKMNPAVNVMSDVVVVGYGNLRKRDVTGAIGSVSGADIKALSVTRIDQALLGKVAGVQVKPATGEPGAATKIVVRGVGSISAGSSPLYVVDGFPTDNIDMINPNDIANIDILKDASATAIYGSRGANGVIIITTTRGKTGKAEVTFDVYQGWQKIGHRPDMMNAKELAQYYYDGVRNHNLDAGNNVSGPPRQWPIVVPQIVLDVLEGRNTRDEDALDEVLQTAGQQNYQLAVRGGTDNIKYSLSGNFLNQDGIIINSNFKRYSLNANLDFKISQKLSLKMSLNPSYTTSNDIQASGGDGGTTSEGIVGQALYVHNFTPLFVDAQGNAATKETGDYLVFSGLESQGAIVNPVALATEINASRKKTGIIGNINLEYKILPDLKFNFLVGGTVMNTRRDRFKPQLPAFFNNPATGRSESSMNTNWLTEYTLSYNKAIGKHNISALGGFTAQKDLFEFNNLTSDKYPNNLVPTLNATSGVITGGTSEISEWSLLSYLARVNYNFNSKYYLTASIRTDGSSRFGADKKWGVFPSAALAWRVTEEDFAKNIRFLNDLKLRVSYGETGNNNIGNYEHQSTIRYLLYPLNSVLNNAYAPQRIENPLLTWETQKQINFGIDISVFNKRINLTVDHFRSQNEDLLLNVAIPAVTGFGNTLKNIGQIKNTGWEFTLNTVNINGKFRWTTDFNISFFKNEVVKLGPKGDPIYSGASITAIGHPIGAYWGWLTDGIYLNQAEVDKGPKYNPTGVDRSRPGDVRFVDISGPNGKPDGLIDGLDKTFMGNPFPDFYYGMSNQLSYENFTLAFSLQGVNGIDVFAATRGTIANSRARYRQQAHLLNYWKSESDPGDGKTPRPNNSPTGNFRGAYSQLWLDDGSYLRINNISFGYLLPRKITESLKMNSFKFYITATNPFLFTNYRQFNPDVSNNGSSLEPNVDINDYPLQKSLIVGINVTF